MTHQHAMVFMTRITLQNASGEAWKRQGLRLGQDGCARQGPTGSARQPADHKHGVMINLCTRVVGSGTVWLRTGMERGRTVDGGRVGCCCGFSAHMATLPTHTLWGVHTEPSALEFTRRKGARWLLRSLAVLMARGPGHALTRVGLNSCLKAACCPLYTMHYVLVMRLASRALWAAAMLCQAACYFMLHVWARRSPLTCCSATTASQSTIGYATRIRK